MTTYYSGGRFRGQGWREIATEEAADLRLLADAAPSNPPWTPERAALRDARDRFIVALYEDGVAAASIARVGARALTGPNIGRIISKRRGEFGRGIRRQIPREAENRSESMPYRRDLTGAEVERLRNLDRNVPRDTGQRRDLDTEAAEDLRDYIRALREDRVALATIGRVLGVTREYIRVLANPAIERRLEAAGASA